MNENSTDLTAPTSITGASATFTAFFSVTANNLDVQFVDQSTVPSGAIVSWAWTFGDAGTSTLQNPTHTYAAPGNYVVTLTVTGSSGFVSARNATVSPSAAPEEPPDNPILPVANFTSSVNGLNATFTDTSTPAAAAIASWSWNFGERPTVDFSFVPTGLSVAFTDATTAPSPLTIVGWAWDFGDGTTSAVQNPTRVYAAGGSKTVTLVATASNGQTNTFTKIVAVTSGATLGIPFGMSNAFATNVTLKAAVSSFNLHRGADSPSGIEARIAFARANSLKLVLAMTGGAKTDYLTNGVFDRTKWNAKQKTFDTTAIKTAVADGVADGTVLGASIMDEPFHHGWGPAGTMTKAKVDDMATFTKAIFPTLPCGVDHTFEQFRPTESYHVIDYIWAVYYGAADMGAVTTWRDSNLAGCARDHHQVVFGYNVLAAGNRTNGCLTSGAVCCPEPATQGVGQQGQFQYLCRPTAAQIASFGSALATAGSGFMIWWWDAVTMVTGAYVAANLSAFSTIRSACDAAPRKTWYRTGP